jgi:hypothetical protein
MATLVQTASGFVHFLEAETLVGRSPRASVSIEDRLVSMHHASMLWNGDRWILRDLGSRNGTFVDGRQLANEEQLALEVGMRIGFGSPELSYLCSSIDAPTVMLVALESGAAIAIDNALMAIPSPERPCATLALHDDGFWSIELGDDTRMLLDQERLEIDGVSYRFCENRGSQRTMPSARSKECINGEFTLELACSLDEEHVELSVSQGDKRSALGTRSCYYALLMLARCRLGQGLPAHMTVDRDGWIATSTLATMLNTTEQHVNVDIFRIRKALQSAELADAAALIERRSGRLRLATNRVSLRQL